MSLKKPEVITHRFGEIKTWEFRIGRVIGMYPNRIEVEFKDDTGKWTESYSARSGIRICDIGEETGWRIPKEDLKLVLEEQQEVAPPVQKVPGRGLIKIHEDVEELPGGEEELVVQLFKFKDGSSQPVVKTFIREVWRDEETDEVIYGRERPAVMPFGKILELLYEFAPLMTSTH